jgi:hypothetical protein
VLIDAGRASRGNGIFGKGQSKCYSHLPASNTNKWEQDAWKPSQVWLPVFFPVRANTNVDLVHARSVRPAVRATRNPGWPAGKPPGTSVSLCNAPGQTLVSKQADAMPAGACTCQVVMQWQAIRLCMSPETAYSGAKPTALAAANTRLMHHVNLDRHRPLTTCVFRYASTCYSNLAPPQVLEHAVFGRSHTFHSQTRCLAASAA